MEKQFFANRIKYPYKFNRAEPSCPIPREDWGYNWLLENLEDIEGRKCKAPVLNLRINTQEYNWAGLRYLFRVQNRNVKIPMFQKWSMGGWGFDYSIKELSTIDYHLLCTKEIQNAESEDAALFKPSYYISDIDLKREFNLVKLIQTSKQFELVGHKKLPNGTYLKLYKRIGTKPI